MKIGFIGLGIMGSRMAMNLLKNVTELNVYNRTKSKADELLEQGAVWNESPAKLAKDCDVVFTMLSTPKAVGEVAFGEDGFVEQMKKGALWLDCSTVNPSFSRMVADSVLKQNKRFMDAPVAGSLKPAENGELVFLVGGEPTDFDEIRYLLEYMGKAIHHLGSVGKGSSAKMVVNSMLGQAMVAFSEAIALGKSLDLDNDKLFEILIGGPLTAPFIGLKEEKLKNSEYSPEFPLKWMHKDLNLAAWSAYENNCVLPALNAGKEIYSGAKANGMGDLDMSAVYDYMINKLNNKQ
ncbi:MAG: NAD(P)-dependent oxidoreductase [Bacteroidales bacterium]|nr:NAD(P)-dependent oxidoreductase [Bacteroidales bacterium]MCF8343640.1 NAD(P)-dependent oxidoreductase [Bacteroidales bacterium]MCF8352264.1 NAD(P)-dependent oxidoreductase [Bacteroidales bacterium]MCF8375180.1 NAD(P)-dependent oxidoreductase [Bacteroidales bacterium]MCF8400698.1 NAD(P)-dependent oxidoreductase [Bacteroidales bacterium]